MDCNRLLIRRCYIIGLQSVINRISNLIIQWGVCTVSANSHKTEILPTTFTMAYSIANSQYNQRDYIRALQPNDISSINIYNDNSTNSCGISYIVIGY